MRLAIFGIGAMGCLFGARLSPHADVTLIGHWPEQLDALRRGPLRLERAEGDATEARLKVVDGARASGGSGTFEAALILTKSGGTEEAARLAADILRPDGVALTLQNGIGNWEVIARRVGEARAAQGVTAAGATMLGPGHVREGGPGSTHLATRPAIHLPIEALAMLFEQGGFQTSVVEDVRGLVWGKLAVNAAINPLTALLRVPNGALTTSAFARAVMAEAAREVAEVAAAQGIALPFPDAAGRADEVARLTAVNHSSMLQDALRGAETEIESICGAVVREGQRLGVPTPTNLLLYRLVKAMEQGYDVRVS